MPITVFRSGAHSHTHTVHTLAIGLAGTPKVAMSNAPLCLLYSVLLASLVSFSFLATAEETSTFSTTNIVVCRLLSSDDGASPVGRLDAQFRTSHANNSGLIGLQNSDGERISVLVANEAELTLSLAWIPDGSRSSFGEGAKDDGFELATLDLSVNSTGLGSGEWHHLTVYPSNGGSLLLDGALLGSLPSNFSAQFAWNGTVVATVGGDFRGCLANVSLDEVAQVPLHSQSELLNQTGSNVSVDTAASSLPDGGPGCRQDPCQCLPNGVCVYKQWNVLQGCNCSRGYEGQLCESEWNTCQHLDAASVCLNGGRCDNLAGPDAYRCTCTPVGHYLGSRCQSFNHCRDPVSCQNGANCTLLGDPETPSNLDYRCTCTEGFTGRNCTDPVHEPDGIGGRTDLIVGITVGVIAILLLLIVALVAVKVIRDRRKDAGVYKPSQRENYSNVYADQDTIGMSQVMRPPKDERFI